MSAHRKYESWGRISCAPIAVLAPEMAEKAMPPLHSWLAFGNGRSYGDSCLTDGGVVLDMRGSNRILSFSPETGILRAEAGILLGDILAHVVPQGWFLPVVPGTQFVTLGGAVANDIHGKNHHVAGTFGLHVRRLELLRTGGVRRICAPGDSEGWFRATIGGMGLTGLITWVELQLVPISSPWIAQETLPFASLDNFFALAEASDRDFAYSVAWIDSLARGDDLGRGVLFRGNHAPGPGDHQPGEQVARTLTMPVDPPFALINRVSLALFNQVYRRAALSGPRRRLVHYRTFFFPLDRVRHWNRAYGPRGLRQFQCVLPLDGAREAIAALLRCATEARHASFLTVLKLFGDRLSPGLLSFPRRGATLTLDFPYRGAATDRLLAALDAITLGAGGAVNPYKDARMSAEVFAASFPGWQAIRPYLDPSARSGFSARVGLVPQRAEQGA
jgi:FAD/FMN-containing dehydrogenase